MIYQIIKKTLLPILLAILVLVLFIYLRWNNISQQLYFRNDMGRDFLMLYDWQKSGKPPLLGPQTNFLPFNQSAIYFYFFYPIFVISDHSLYTTNITLSIMYISTFLFGLFFFRKQKKQLFILLFTGLIFSIHPHAINQTRYVWNPSFVPLFLITSYFFFIRLQKNFSNKNLAFFTMSLSLAVGMSVSAIPALIAFLFLGVIVFRKDSKKILKLLIGIILSHLIVFFPFLIFEIKYHFQILTRIISQEKILNQNIQISFLEKLLQMLDWLLPSIKYNVALMIFILGLSFRSINKKIKNIVIDENTQLIFLFLTSAFLIGIFPINLEGHYIFGPLSFLILLLANLPKKIVVFLTIILMFFWLHPSVTAQYFNEAPRTISLTEKCFADFCLQHKEPIFVSVQSSHNYHYGPEFRYLMKNSDCNVEDIEIDKNKADKMAVISDSSKYVHNKTDYEELSLFGPSDEISVFSCSSKLKIHILKKTTNIDPPLTE